MINKLMIEKLQPGRELDAAVAVAMGYNVSRDSSGEPYISGAVIGDQVISWVKNYSTDISAAMEAWAWLERHHRFGDHRDTAVALGAYDGNISVLIFGLMEGKSMHLRYTIQGETYSHAIALAVIAIVKGPGAYPEFFVS